MAHPKKYLRNTNRGYKLIVWRLRKTSIFKFTFKANTIMGKVSKETRREQRYNANLHNLFVKAQEEIANE